MPGLLVGGVLGVRPGRRPPKEREASPGTAAPTARPLAAHDAQLVAWLLLAVLNAVVVAVTLEPAPLPVTLAHHALDGGQMLAAGLLARAMVGVWMRFGHSDRKRGSIALLCVALLGDWLFVRADLMPRAAKLAGNHSPWWWLLLMLLVAASSIVAAAWAGALARRGLFRWLAVVAAGQLVVANHVVLVLNYPGVHLHVVLLSATFIGSCLTEIRLPPSLYVPPLARRLGHLCAAVLAAASVVVQPSSTVVVRMLSRPGSAFEPFISRLHAYVRTRHESAEYPQAESGPELPPSQPPWIAGEPVVVLVTLDALRADIVNQHLADTQLPQLARLRDAGILFRDARTPAPATMVALASVFSSRYFSQLYWSEYRAGWQFFPHEDTSPRLPALLAEAGVATATYYGTDWLAPDTGIIGAFSEHRYIAPTKKMAPHSLTAAARLNAAAIERLEQQGSGKLFVYMHWLEAHAPYDLGTTNGTPYERYLAELALVDAELRGLAAALERAELRERAVLLVSSDHGEAFGEHHTEFHGVTVYDELVRVPLIAWRPTQTQPRTIDEPVSLMDLAPTILDLMGAPTPGAMMGRSLVPLLTTTTTTNLASRPVAIDSGRHQQSIVFGDGFKVIYDRRRGNVELYDLRLDPAEADNLVQRLPSETQLRLEVLNRFFGTHRLRREGYELPFRTP